MVVDAVICVFNLSILKHESGRYACLSLVGEQHAIEGNSLDTDCLILVNAW